MNNLRVIVLIGVMSNLIFFVIVFNLRIKLKIIKIVLNKFLKTISTSLKNVFEYL